MIELRSVDVSKVAESILSGFRDRAESQACQLSCEIEPGTWALADPGALEQILSNLTENAIKYSGGGAVTIWAERTPNERVRLGVDVVGAGISPEHQARLFERFYRVDPGRSRDQGGTGLGLAIVKHLCEAMNGDVSVESRSPKGTRFIVELALTNPGRDPSLAPASRPPTRT